MTQRWNDLLFLHFPFAPEAIRALVPEALTLDTYDRRAWLSITPFWLNHLRPAGVPSVPWVSSFPEINVRTYVTHQGKPGVFFFSLDAGNLSAVWGARIFYRLPYWHASMKIKGQGTDKIEYRSKREHGPRPAEFQASYAPTSRAFRAGLRSPDQFLTERYCLYAYNRKRLYRAEIHHLPWELQDAEYEIPSNTMTKPLALSLPGNPELVRFSREIKVLVWAPERVA